MSEGKGQRQKKMSAKAKEALADVEVSPAKAKKKASVKKKAVAIAANKTPASLHYEEDLFSALLSGQKKNKTSTERERQKAEKTKSRPEKSTDGKKGKDVAAVSTKSVTPSKSEERRGKKADEKAKSPAVSPNKSEHRRGKKADEKRKSPAVSPSKSERSKERRDKDAEADVSSSKSVTPTKSVKNVDRRGKKADEKRKSPAVSPEKSHQQGVKETEYAGTSTAVVKYVVRADGDDTSTDNEVLLDSSVSSSSSSEREDDLSSSKCSASDTSSSNISETSDEDSSLEAAPSVAYSNNQKSAATKPWVAVKPLCEQQKAYLSIATYQEVKTIRKLLSSLIRSSKHLPLAAGNRADLTGEEERMMFPIRTEMELEAIELKLEKSPQLRAQFKIQFELIGGKDWKKMVFQVMDYVLSNQVARQYSYDGKGGKYKAFKQTFLSTVIRLAVQGRFPINKEKPESATEANDTNIGQRIGLWLTNSKDKRKKDKYDKNEGLD